MQLTKQKTEIRKRTKVVEQQPHQLIPAQAGSHPRTTTYFFTLSDLFSFYYRTLFLIQINPLGTTTTPRFSPASGCCISGSESDFTSQFKSSRNRVSQRCQGFDSAQPDRLSVVSTHSESGGTRVLVSSESATVRKTAIPSLATAFIFTPHFSYAKHTPQKRTIRFVKFVAFVAFVVSFHSCHSCFLFIRVIRVFFYSRHSQFHFIGICHSNDKE